MYQYWLIVPIISIYVNRIFSFRRFSPHFRHIVPSRAGTALRTDLSHRQQRPFGQRRSDQLIDQHSKQHHIPGKCSVRKLGSGKRHAQGNTRLGKQGNAQVVCNGPALPGQPAADGSAIVLAGGSRQTWIWAGASPGVSTAISHSSSLPEVAVRRSLLTGAFRAMYWAA